MSELIANIQMRREFEALGLSVQMVDVIKARWWLAFYCVPLDGAQVSDLIGAIDPLAEAISVPVSIWRREAGVGILLHWGGNDGRGIAGVL